jgi:hypothetical protein
MIFVEKISAILANRLTLEIEEDKAVVKWWMGKLHPLGIATHHETLPRMSENESD